MRFPCKNTCSTQVLLCWMSKRWLWEDASKLGTVFLLTENPKAVLAALRRGETDGIVPAASGFMDRFAQFMIELGIPQFLDKFPDHRKRKWISAFLSR